METVFYCIGLFFEDVVSPLFEGFKISSVVLPFLIAFIVWRFLLEPLFRREK